MQLFAFQKVWKILFSNFFDSYRNFHLTGDSGDLRYGPGNLLDKNVIFVSINYRLGVFGFLSLGNDVLPGNLGK